MHSQTKCNYWLVSLLLFPKNRMSLVIYASHFVLFWSIKIWYFNWSQYTFVTLYYKSQNSKSLISTTIKDSQEIWWSLCNNKSPWLKNLENQRRRNIFTHMQFKNKIRSEIPFLLLFTFLASVNCLSQKVVHCFENGLRMLPSCPWLPSASLCP